MGCWEIALTIADALWHPVLLIKHANDMLNHLHPDGILSTESANVVEGVLKKIYDGDVPYKTAPCGSSLEGSQVCRGADIGANVPHTPYPMLLGTAHTPQRFGNEPCPLRPPPPICAQKALPPSTPPYRRSNPPASNSPPLTASMHLLVAPRCLLLQCPCCAQPCADPVLNARALHHLADTENTHLLIPSKHTAPPTLLLATLSLPLSCGTQWTLPFAQTQMLCTQREST